MSPVIEYLESRGAPFLVIPCPGAATVAESVARHGFAVEELVSTVVITTRFGHALLVVGARREVDLELVVRALGDADVRVAGERDVARAFADHEPGSLPPLGRLLEAPIYVDTDVARLGSVIFAAGRPDVAIRMSTEDLFGGDPVVIAPLTRASGDDPPGPGDAVTVREAEILVTEAVPEDEPAE